jgi:hypothetical protein
MRNRIWWCWILGVALLAGCGSQVIPVVPPQPVPPIPTPPGPTPPPTPPPNPSQVATAENVSLVKVGMTWAEVQAALGVPSSFDSRQDDGTRLTDWPAVDEDGKPVYLSVHFDAAGIVIGRSRLPRAVAPPEPVASLSGEPEPEPAECPGGNCAAPCWR